MPASCAEWRLVISMPAPCFCIGHVVVLSMSLLRGYSAITASHDASQSPLNATEWRSKSLLPASALHTVLCAQLEGLQRSVYPLW